jgi:DNA (cytosine-5)-methyltransferase 1
VTKLRVLDLFSGIGGFSLGLERTGGFETVAFCEIEEFPRRVLAKHWPEVPCYDDVRTLTAERLAADGIAVDVITGGFPCQDISVAGKQAGVSEGTRSGLYKEVLRIADIVKPRYLFLENVAAILSNGLGTVLADLAALGYDSRWCCIRASDVGAPHYRDRWFLLGDTSGGRFSQPRQREVEFSRGAEVICTGKDFSDANLKRLQGNWKKPNGSHRKQVRRMPSSSDWWDVEPGLVRVANGVSDRVGQLKGYGNAQVPLQAAAAWRLLGGE